MYATVYSFEHLRAAEDADRDRELELRRRSLERGDVTPSLLSRLVHGIGARGQAGSVGATARRVPATR